MLQGLHACFKNEMTHLHTYPDFPRLSHDRFLIIDEHDIYHIGASLKDLGKRWFAFSKLESGSFGLMDQIRKSMNNTWGHKL